MQIDVPGLVFEDEDDTETIQENIEEPVPVPTRPDFIQSMPPPEKPSIMDIAGKGMGATMFGPGEADAIKLFDI